MRRFLRRLRALVFRRRFEAELEQELQFHLEQLAEEGRRSGIEPSEAAADARRRLGSSALIRERVRDVFSFRRLEVIRDVRFALRMLRKAPGITAAAVTTLAVGVGLNTAIFSLVQSVLLRQLPYHDPAAVVSVTQHDSAGPARFVSATTVRELRIRSRTIESVSVYADGQMTLVDHDQPEVWRGMRVSPGFFDTVGVKVLMGRAFLPEEDKAERSNVIILTHDLWLRRFAGDPTTIGRILSLNAEPYRVIGILPSNFQSLRMTNPAETPQYFALAGEGYDGRVIARLKPSMTPGQANAELGAVIHDIARQFPAEYASDATLRVQPLLDDLTGPLRRSIWFLFGAVGFVLAIACANVASLQLARAAARTREFATRAALGGGRMRLVSQLLIESLVLALAGGAAGVLTGLVGTRAIASWAPRELPRIDEIQMDGGVLLFTLAITLITGIVFGVAPAWLAARVGVNDMLKRTSGVTGRAAGKRLRHALVVVNVALAFALVLATGLLVKSFRNLNALDPGFNPHDVLTLTPVMPPPATGSMTPSGRLAWYRALIASVRSVPGVTAVGLVSNVPMSHTEPFPMRLEGAAAVSDAEAPSVDVFWVSSDYHRALDIPLKRGRWLTDRDGVAAPPAVLVSESFARLRFGGADPVGRRIQAGPQRTGALWSVIVGVVGDVRNDALDRAPREAIYQPHAMNPFHYVRLVARTSGEPLRAERAVRAAIRAADPGTAVFHVQPMDDYVASSLAERRFATTLTALFGFVAFLLAAVGIGGVMSHSVVERTPEIGVRAALGAGKSRVFTMILREGLAVTAIGLVLGLLIALGGARLISSFLFGVGAVDPGTFLMTAAMLLAVAAVASYFPARAAARISPLDALRAL
jgi:predicted permease